MTDDPRVFSVEEANAMLDEIRPRLARVRDARAAVIRTAEQVQGMVAADGGGVAGDRGYWEAAQVLRAELEALAAAGVVLRDPESGLVDFLGEVEGRRVWLCWRLGEPSVAHFHEMDSGFAGRRPL